MFEELQHKPNKQAQFLRRLLDALDSSVPSSYVEKAYHGAKFLRQFRAGGELRGYCLFEDSPPAYNFFVFVWITEHDYDRHDIGQFDERANEWAAEIRTIQTEVEAEQFATEYGAFDTDAVVQAMHRLDINPPPDWTDRQQ